MGGVGVRGVGCGLGEWRSDWSLVRQVKDHEPLSELCKAAQRIVQIGLPTRSYRKLFKTFISVCEYIHFGREAASEFRRGAFAIIDRDRETL